MRRLRQPEKLSLHDIDIKLKRYKEAPLETVSTFRRALRLSRYPQWLRRWLWWAAWYLFGTCRAIRWCTSPDGRSRPWC